MTDTFERVARDPSVSLDRPLHQPDVFVRSAYIVDEMADVSASIAVQLVELRAARSQRSAEDMKRACDLIAKYILQLASMNFSLTNQIAMSQRNAQDTP